MSRTIHKKRHLLEAYRKRNQEKQHSWEAPCMLREPLMPITLMCAEQFPCEALFMSSATNFQRNNHFWIQFQQVLCQAQPRCVGISSFWLVPFCSCVPLRRSPAVPWPCRPSSASACPPPSPSPPFSAPSSCSPLLQGAYHPNPAFSLPCHSVHGLSSPLLTAKLLVPMPQPWHCELNPCSKVHYPAINLS